MPALQNRLVLLFEVYYWYGEYHVNLRRIKMEHEYKYKSYTYTDCLVYRIREKWSAELFGFPPGAV